MTLWVLSLSEAVDERYEGDEGWGNGEGASVDDDGGGTCGGGGILVKCRKLQARRKKSLSLCSLYPLSAVHGGLSIWVRTSYYGR